MGCLSSKTGPKVDGDNEEVSKDRRRLSVSKAAEVKNDSSNEPRGQVNLTSGSINDLFPDAKRRFSITGAHPDSLQKGFDDKQNERKGDSPNDLCMGYACKKGLKPESPNQDDFCIFHVDGVGIFGVFDGHGPFGHDISSFVHHTLPRCFVKDKDFPSSPEKALAEAFPKTHALCAEAGQAGKFDCSLSGTTATMLMLRGNEFYSAHVGDSRAVLARKARDGCLEAKDITEDHKPQNEEEKKRIQSAGGQVRRLEGDIPHRIFLAGKMYPGLAMSRSIGDTVGASAGVTSNPDVTKWKVDKDWRFVLLCSDGVWEFITSQEAVDMVGKYPPSEVQKAVEALAQESWDRWKKEETDVVDDITVICVWFNQG